MTPTTTPDARHNRLFGWVICAAIAAATLLAYSRTFSVPLIFDDDTAIVNNSSIRHIGSALHPPENTTAGGRPVLNLSLAINYAVSGTSVVSYHAVNVLIHVLSSLTLFGILRRGFRRILGADADIAAAIAVSLWALHPLNTQAVTYVVQRAESLMGLFYLLTIYCFIRGAEVAKRGSAWFALSVLACYLGMGTKEVMVSVPLLVILYDRAFISGDFAKAWTSHRRYYLALCSSWLLLGYLVFSAKGRGGSAGFSTNVSSWDYAMTQFWAIAHYLRLCFWPRPLIFDYGSDVITDSSRIFPGMVLVVVLFGTALWTLAKRPALGILALGFFALLAPSSSFIPVATETIAEHRMYLPLVSVIGIVVIGAMRLGGKYSLLPLLLAVVACFWATWTRNLTYGNTEQLFRELVSLVPNNPRAHVMLGKELKSTGHTVEAVAEYEEALRTKPDYATAHNDLGSALLALPGHLDEATTHLREAIRLNPLYMEAHANLGNALVRTPGHLNEAIDQYESALKIKPDSAEVDSNLGHALNLAGRKDEAVQKYSEALRLRPDLLEAHFNLGNIWLASPEHLDDAVAQFREVVRLNPNLPQGRFSLAYALSKVPGGGEEARIQLREGLRLKPGDVFGRKMETEIFQGRL